MFSELLVIFYTKCAANLPPVIIKYTGTICMFSHVKSRHFYVMTQKTAKKYALPNSFDVITVVQNNSRVTSRDVMFYNDKLFKHLTCRVEIRIHLKNPLHSFQNQNESNHCFKIVSQRSTVNIMNAICM